MREANASISNHSSYEISHTRTKMATDAQNRLLFRPVISENTILLLLLFLTKISTISDKLSYESLLTLQIHNGRRMILNYRNSIVFD